MSSGQGRASRQRAGLSVAAQGAGMGMPLAPPLMDDVDHVLVNPLTCVTVVVGRDGRRTTLEERKPIGYFGQIMSGPSELSGLQARVGKALTESSRVAASIEPAAEAIAVTEPTGDVRVLTLQPSGHDSMDPTWVRLAELTRNFSLAETEGWRRLTEELGTAEIFAIESAPLTFDVDEEHQVFTGRARVLADIYDREAPHDFVESRVIDARVSGRFENGEPKIRDFAFQPSS